MDRGAHDRCGTDFGLDFSASALHRAMRGTGHTPHQAAKQQQGEADGTEGWEDVAHGFLFCST